MKPSLPRFIEFKLDHGGLYIMSTDYPYHIGQIWKFKTEDEVMDMSQKYDDFTTVSGYNILIVLCGNLANEYQGRTDEILDSLKTFLLSRINERPMGWRRYLIEK